LLIEIGHHRRYIGVTREPRLHRVLVGGHDIDQMVGHQRSNVSADEVVKNGIGERWSHDEECNAGGDRAAGDAAERTFPEWFRPPARQSRNTVRAVEGGFFIERTHDPCAQRRRSASARAAQVLSQRGARSAQVFEQRAALGAALAVALALGRGKRIEFAVEICLHAQ
jgi:hypothetical protein